MTYFWTTPHEVDVNFEVIFRNSKDEVEYCRPGTTFTPAAAVECYLLGWEDDDYYSLPDRIQEQITRDFTKWLEDHELTLPQPPAEEEY